MEEIKKIENIALEEIKHVKDEIENDEEIKKCCSLIDIIFDFIKRLRRL